jgi:pyridoxal phosphate enzyme (YggS family)
MNKPLKRLRIVQERIESACIAAGRPADEVTLLVVSKRHSAEKVIIFNKLGVTAFGENQLQEALRKQQELQHLDLQWHFIGSIQSNKTRDIAANFQWVHSVDREKVLQRLAQHRPAGSDPLNICLQVNIDMEPQKAGASVADIFQLATLADSLESIRLRGLMAIPKLSNDPQQQHASFRKVRCLFEELKDSGHDIDTLSMGMSADLEIAIAEGSTMVRIGTDLMGYRPI